MDESFEDIIVVVGWRFWEESDHWCLEDLGFFGAALTANFLDSTLEIWKWPIT